MTLIGLITIILCYFTFTSAWNVIRTDWMLPPTTEDDYKSGYRLVLITQELDTPFWNQVSDGALEQAIQDGVSMEVWGSYGKNEEDFLQKIEIAIMSKVDGIIVQGLDTEEFKELTKIKAGLYGIPIITVANDVPMQDSLRKTYVGSDQYSAGQMIGRELVSNMDAMGTVVLIGGSEQQYYLKQRLEGIQNVLQDYPDIVSIYVETSDARERVVAATRDVLNRYPETEAFIAINANVAESLIQEIERRSQIEKYHIFSFDDGPESLSLLKKGKLEGMIEQSPKEMGRKSVYLMTKWLKGEMIPLNMDGYYTEIGILNANDVL